MNHLRIVDLNLVSIVGARIATLVLQRAGFARRVRIAAGRG
jgi:hypothetical protein